MQGIKIQRSKNPACLVSLGVYGPLKKKIDFPDLHMCILRCLEDKNLDNDSCLFNFLSVSVKEKIHTVMKISIWVCNDNI